MQSAAAFPALALAEAIEAAPAAERRRAMLGFVALGLTAYALVLIATFPARVALKWVGADALSRAASGAVWNGRAGFGSGLALEWQVTPFRSLGELSVSANMEVHGPGTDLTGRARWRPGVVTLANVSGDAGWPLIAALAPKLPLSCDASFAVEISRLVLAGSKSGAQGRLTSGAGACRSLTGTSTSIPALLIAATHDDTGSRAWLSPLTQRGMRLADASLSRDGVVKIEVHPAGAALLPTGTSPASLSLETRL